MILSATAFMDGANWTITIRTTTAPSVVTVNGVPQRFTQVDDVVYVYVESTGLKRWQGKKTTTSFEIHVRLDTEPKVMVFNADENDSIFEGIVPAESTTALMQAVGFFYAGTGSSGEECLFIPVGDPLGLDVAVYDAFGDALTVQAKESLMVWSVAPVEYHNAYGETVPMMGIFMDTALVQYLVSRDTDTWAPLNTITHRVVVGQGKSIFSHPVLTRMLPQKVFYGGVKWYADFPATA